MGHYLLKILYCLCLWPGVVQAGPLNSSSLDEVSFRFYDQWKTGDQERKNLQEKYDISYLHFNKRGEILIEGLSRANKSRLVRFYNQCMQDGCLFCDASDGYCETGTCGPHNRDCKPYMLEGRPLCGEECAYYALRQL